MTELLQFVLDNLIGGLRGNIRFTRNQSVSLPRFSVEEHGNETVFSAPVPGYRDFRITAVQDDATVMLRLDCQHAAGEYRSFQPENSVNFAIGGGEEPEAIRYYYHLYTSCLQPEWCHSFDGLGNRTHTALLRFGDVHYHILCLTGDIFRCDFDRDGYHISVYDSGYQSLHGTFLVVSRAADPFEAIRRSYRFARVNGGIRVPLKEERTLPALYRGLGYCTFNTWDLAISEERILQKMDEYRAAGVPLQWVLIDDGWMTYEGQYLTGLHADPIKFPHGLRPLIEKLKTEYGIRNVGIWVAFGAYWRGLGEGSEAFLTMRDTLMQTKSGYWLPSLYDGKGERFWDTWFGYLAECSVDFVKVDCQSQYQNMVEGEMPTLEACRIMHNAIERAAAKHFSGGVHNCMGMDIENVYARPLSAVARNSRDFEVNPQAENRDLHSFTMDNVLGAVWHDQMQYADFDMWWSSDRPSAVHSAVLRAIHDGPHYVSDPGPCNPDVIRPSVGEHGEHELCDHGAYPTLDCLYEDRPIFKVWNQSGENFALAVYNVSTEAAAETFRLSVIPGIRRDTDYIAYEYFTKNFTRVRADSELRVDLAHDGLRTWSFYPVQNDGDGEWILLGDITKYISAKTAKKTKIAVRELPLPQNDE